jgi:hypothetical protein
MVLAPDNSKKIQAEDSDMVFRGSSRQMPAARHCLESIARINAELEHEVVACLMNEGVIERWWSRACRLGGDCPGYWLLMAQLAEAALICAGNYADNCEYEAAGDLLVNPREILIHPRGEGRSTAKNRHGRLSEQFGLEVAEGHNSLKLFSAGMRLETSKPPLLPWMTQVLRSSERISTEYLQRLEDAQRRIADTLAFLAAWRVFDSAELWRRLQESSARERVFAEFHLCRFDARVFHRIGTDLRRSLAEQDYRSPFLTGFGSGEIGLKRTAPETVHALAGSTA